MPAGYGDGGGEIGWHIADVIFRNVNVHLLIVCLGGFLALLPILPGITSELHLSVHLDGLDNFEGYRRSSLVAVTLLVPILFDSILEFYYSHICEPFADIKLPKDALSIPEKLVLITGLAIAPIVGALDLGSYMNGDSVVYMCCRKSQTILVLGVVMTSLSRYKSYYYHRVSGGFDPRPGGLHVLHPLHVEGEGL